MLDVVGKILPAITIFVLIMLAIAIIFSKNFWIFVGHHVVDGIAKYVGKIVIFFISVAIIVLFAILLKK